MPTVVKRTIHGKIYYYLEHSIRNSAGQITKKSKYLGSSIPKDLRKIETQFVYELNSERWFKIFDAIRVQYLNELKSLPRTAQEKALNEFSIRFTYDTQRIEGSTLTLRETAQLLDEGVSPGGKPLSDIREAEAHQRVFLEMLRLKKDLTLQLVLDWHHQLFKETKPDIAGQIRKHRIRISGSRFVPPSPVEIQPLLREFISWYNSSKNGKIHPAALAALVHLKFVTIHPFIDGNGRIGRLMMNFVLNRNRYPMLNIEYEGRRTYYGALERSQVKNDENPFSQWFFRKYLRENKRYTKD